ncbi:MAG: Crp/Fnr family transcriptional regulator [Casimicrobiaceae bacterium]
MLAALPSADFERLRPDLEPVALPLGLVVREAGSHVHYAYFPVTGIVSLEQELANGATAEVALTGNDGMLGLALIAGGGTTTTRAFVRAEGIGYRLRADRLRKEFERSRALREILLRYAQLLFTQVAQTIACRRHHSVEQQVCKVLLSTIDRSGSEDLALTQGLIAELVGARRESVTAVAGALQMAGVIRYHRGRITVLDRPALAGRACECHAAIKREALRLFAQPFAAPARPTIAPRHAQSDFALAAD